MGKLEHWVRDEEGNRVTKEIPEYVDVQMLQERIDDIKVVVPYIQQAFTVILFSLTNSRNYPQTRNAIEAQDKIFLETGAYEGLTEGQKAKLLIDELLE